MKTLRHILLAGMPLLAAGGGMAQDWRPASAGELQAAIRACGVKYEAYAFMRMTTQIDAYLSPTDRTPHQRSTSTLWRMGDRYRTDYMGVRTFQDGQLRVVVDEDQRSILVGLPEVPVAAWRNGLQDSVLAHASRIGRALQADGTHYRLLFDGFLGYDAIEVVFDREGWMRRIELLWAYDVDLRYRDPSSPQVRPKVVMELGLPERVAPGSVDADPLSVVEMRPGDVAARGRWKGYNVFDTRVP